MSSKEEKKSDATVESTTAWLLKKDPTTGLGPAGFYARCMFGGLAACGVTHASVTPLDVSKCRSQTWGKAGKWPAGLIPSMKRTWAEEGTYHLSVIRI